MNKQKNRKRKPSDNNKQESSINVRQILVTSAISSLASLLIMATIGIINFRVNTERNVGSIQSKLDSIKDEMKKDRDDYEEVIQSINGDIGVINSRMIDIGERVAKLEGQVASVKNMKANPVFAQSLIIDPSSLVFLKDDSVVLSQPIAYSQEEGKVVLADELIDQRTIYTYNDGNNQVVFCGQYDDEGRWDGNCIINVYDNEKHLIRILDGDYLQGQLINYRQVLSDDSRDGDIWLVSDRIVGQSSNHGATWKYKRDDYITLDCDISELSEDKIYDVDKFIQTLDILIIEYYEGDTSSLLYNDNSGKAYLVKYFTDNQDKYNKYVKTLYVGCLSDGQFNDHTGEAWYIVKDTNTEYMYYKGGFTDGNPDGHEVEIPLSLDRINEIIQQSDVEFDCPLDWDV